VLHPARRAPAPHAHGARGIRRPLSRRARAGHRGRHRSQWTGAHRQPDDRAPARRFTDTLLRAGARPAIRFRACPERALAESRRLRKRQAGGNGDSRRAMNLTHFSRLDCPVLLLYITSRLYNSIVMHTSERLDLTFAALSDPTRRAILARLAKGEATVTELAEPFEMSQPAISKHLKVLERAGLISMDVDAQRRPRRLEPIRLKEAVDWIERYREIFEQNYQRLDALLRELQAKPPQRKRMKR